MNIEKIIIIPYFIILLLTVNAYSQECTKDQAKEIETIAAQLKSWDSMYLNWKQFKHCDDGAIAEGFSESISLLLAEHWSETNKLFELMKKDPDFKAFILKHIDETVPRDRLAAITHLCKTNCISGEQIICQEIYDRANY